VRASTQELLYPHFTTTPRKKEREKNIFTTFMCLLFRRPSFPKDLLVPDFLALTHSKVLFIIQVRQKHVTVFEMK
jgi:hypothetical protein